MKPFLSRKENVTRCSMLLIYSSQDPDAGEWTLVKPEDVPEDLKDPNVMGCLVAGDLGKVRGGKLWYRAEKADAVRV